MRILVTGANGLLGEAVVRISEKTNEVIPLAGRRVCDIRKTKDTLESICKSRPDVIIHTAAIADPDTAERYPEKTHLINCIGTRNVALAAKKVAAKMVYISTESVYDGKKRTPYLEYDKTNPTSFYGQTKLMGEDITSSLLEKYFILRLPFLYGFGGNPEDNPAKKIIDKVRKGQVVEVPADQYSQPTFVDLIADIIVKLIKTDYFGIYNTSCPGVASRYDFYHRLIKELGLETSKLIPVADAQTHRLVPRTRYSTMANQALEATLNLSLPPWDKAVKIFADRIKEQGI